MVSQALLLPLLTVALCVDSAPLPSSSLSSTQDPPSRAARGEARSCTMTQAMASRPPILRGLLSLRGGGLPRGEGGGRQQRASTGQRRKTSSSGTTITKRRSSAIPQESQRIMRIPNMKPIQLKYKGWRINASTAPGAYPGPAARIIHPTPEEIEDFTNGGGWPVPAGGDIDAVDWEKDWGGQPPSYIPRFDRSKWQDYAYPGMGMELWPGGVSPYANQTQFLFKLALNEDLWSAAHQGQMHKLLQAIARGADIHSADPREGDKTALHLAADGGHTTVVSMLIQLGMPPMVDDCAFQSPLHYAARGGHTSTVCKLIELGSDPNRTCHGDFTALHFAAMRGQLETARSLVDRGSCVWATDWQHRTPLQVADFWNKTSVVEMLGSAMGLKHDAARDNCGTWWVRHVVTYDEALAGRYWCWCSLCHSPCQKGQKSWYWLAQRTGGARKTMIDDLKDSEDSDSGSEIMDKNGSCVRSRISLADEFDILRDPKDFRHYTPHHPIYNATWNALARARPTADRLAWWQHSMRKPCRNASEGDANVEEGTPLPPLPPDAHCEGCEEHRRQELQDILAPDTTEESDSDARSGPPSDSSFPDSIEVGKEVSGEEVKEGGGSGEDSSSSESREEEKTKPQGGRGNAVAESVKERGGGDSSNSWIDSGMESFDHRDGNQMFLAKHPSGTIAGLSYGSARLALLETMRTVTPEMLEEAEASNPRQGMCLRPSFSSSTASNHYYSNSPSQLPHVRAPPGHAYAQAGQTSPGWRAPQPDSWAQQQAQNLQAQQNVQNLLAHQQAQNLQLHQHAQYQQSHNQMGGAPRVVSAAYPKQIGVPIAVYPYSSGVAAANATFGVLPVAYPRSGTGDDAAGVPKEGGSVHSTHTTG